MTMRSALLNRNIPRRSCVQQVRFKDLEEEGGGALGGGTVPERHRLGAGPGSPHPNRKSPPGAATSGSLVGSVWGDLVGPVGSVPTVLARVPPHPLTPGPTHRARAQRNPLPLSVNRTYSHSLEDIVGMAGPEGKVERTMASHLPRPTTAQFSLPHREGRPLKDERVQSTITSPPSHLHTNSSPCPTVSMATGSYGPTQSRRQRWGRTLTDPEKEDGPCIAPPAGENTERWVERGGDKQTRPLPPMPPPPPPYCFPEEGSSYDIPPMPRPPNTPLLPHPHSTSPTPSKVAPVHESNDREKRGGRIKNTLNPVPNPNPALHQQPYDSCGTTDAPLTSDQARILKEVERLLGGLVSGAQGCTGSKGGLLGPQGPLSDVQDLKTRLQSLEGLLESSHNTISLLLRIIQDLELKEGQSERRRRRTNQSTAGHGTTTNNASVIFTVENDFRLQEGNYAHSWMKADSQTSNHSSSQAIPCPPPNCNLRREEPYLPAPPPFSAPPPYTGRPCCLAKKSRRKCFCFL